MDSNDRSAIQGLFGKLAETGQRYPTRDTEAERFIADQAAQHPGSVYYMAQTVLMQDQALNAAQDRIRQLESDLAVAQRAAQAAEERAATAPAAPSGGGSFLGGLFGRGQQSPFSNGGYNSVPSVQRNAPAAQPASYGAPPAIPNQPAYQQPAAAPQQRGFLAGAAQTAMGVAGGVLLGDMIGNMFSSHGGSSAAAPEEVIVDREVVHDASPAQNASYDSGIQDAGNSFDNVSYNDDPGFDDNSDDWV